MKQVGPTRSQKWMIACMAVAVVALVAFAVIELVGVFNATAEDTFTEWVADLELWAVLTIGGFSALVGVFAIWSMGHYLEWHAARKKK